MVNSHPKSQFYSVNLDPNLQNASSSNISLLPPRLRLRTSSSLWTVSNLSRVFINRRGGHLCHSSEKQTDTLRHSCLVHSFPCLSDSQPLSIPPNARGSLYSTSSSDKDSKWTVEWEDSTKKESGTGVKSQTFIGSQQTNPLDLVLIWDPVKKVSR